MSSAENEAIVRRFVRVMNERDLDALGEIVHEDLIRWGPGPESPLHGLDAFRAFLEQDFAGVPDSRQDILRMVTADDEVAVWVRYHGTQSGPVGPFPATGRPVDLEFAGFLTLRDGRIAEIRVVWDQLALLVGLGHIPPPGGTAS